MKKKELTEKQAFSIVEKIVKDNGLSLDVSLDGSDLKVSYKLDYQGQAKSLAELFSGKNPKNAQDIVSDSLGIFYLVNKDTLFIANVRFRLEVELAYEDSLTSILTDVLDEEPNTKQAKTKNGYTADDLNDWMTLLTELKVSGQKHLHYIEGEQLKQVAENLQSLYNTPSAPLNKVLVTKFLEQWVSKHVSEDYFIKDYVEAAYKKLYNEHGKLKEGFATVMDTFTKYEHYHSLLLSSVIDSFETQLRVVAMVERIALPEQEKSEPLSWDDYLDTLGLESDTILDIKEYIEKNDLEEVDPKKELSGLYTFVQNKIKDVKELAFKRTGVKNTKVEKTLDDYLDKTYFGKETPEKLVNVLDAYSLIQSIGSYLDWVIMLCENYMSGYAEVGLENEQEVFIEEKESTQQGTHKNFDGEDETEAEKFKLYLQYNMQLTESEINVILEFLFDVNPDRYLMAAQGISETTREEIKESKKRVVDSLGLQPSASVKGRKITTKMNKYLKENYLEVNETTKGNCLKLFTKVKAENSTIITELENMYKQEIEVYTNENSNELTDMLNSEDVDFVVERNAITKVLRKSLTDETQTPEQIEALEERVLASYSKDLTEKVYNKSKDVITEYKKLFKQA